MKKTLIPLVLFAITSSTINAQSVDDYIEVAREVLKTEKKAAIAEAMQLTDAESTVFWPLYNEYNAKVNKIHDHRVGLIKSYANQYEKMTDAKADAIWLEAMKINTDLAKLEKTYYKKFKKIIPVIKAARYFQAENKIETLINAQLALEIPLIEPK